MRIIKPILFIAVFYLGSCTTLQQMNSNMEQANIVMAENIKAMETSKATIEENTRQIERSTDTMQRFAYLFPISFFASLLLFTYIFLKLKLFQKIFKNKD